MEVNFIAPVAGMLTVLPGMRRRGSGAIANMSSDDGRAPGAGAADYSASKAALSAATESLSYDARPDGVMLHTVYPGWVPTEMGLTSVRDGGPRCRHVPCVVPRSRSRRSCSAGCTTLAWRSMRPSLPLVAPILRTLAPLTYQRMRAVHGRRRARVPSVPRHLGPQDLPASTGVDVRIPMTSGCKMVGVDP